MPVSVYGLRLTLYTNQNDKLGIFVKYSSVLNLKIENNTLYGDSNVAYDVSSGFRTKVTIERIFKTNLPKPYSNCDLAEGKEPNLADLELCDLIHHSKYNYEQQLCISVYIFI